MLVSKSYEAKNSINTIQCSYNKTDQLITAYLTMSLNLKSKRMN